MRTFLFILFLIMAIVATDTLLSLEVARLSDYGKGYLTGQFLLVVVSIGGLIITGKGMVKKYLL